MQATLERYFRFEKFVERLFTIYELRVLMKHGSPGLQQEVDFVIANSKGTKAAVEVKFYGSLRASRALLQRVFGQINQGMLATKSERGLLVTNAQIPRDLTASISKNITVWDYDTISFLAGRSSELSVEWEEIKQIGFVNRSAPLPPPSDDIEVGFIGDLPELPSEPKPPAPEPRGASLCKALQETKSGRKGKAASIFERAVIEALEYLFENDLINWTPQKSTHDRLHRYDLVARISSENDFWNALIMDHRARYVIFEFKNYGNKIKQSEIYSTEKYLFPQAMRSTAIIVSRKGADRNAIRVIHGAFREAGKLILSLDIEQVCKMLHMRDDGSDPAELLSALIDDMMMGIER